MDTRQSSHANSAQDTNDSSAEEAANKLNHRRSLSGGLLSKLTFLRTALEGPLQPLSQRSPDRQANGGMDDDTSPRRNGAMAAAVRQNKGRKRKGSLRKTAILGTGKLRMEGRDRKNSNPPDPPKWNAELLHGSSRGSPDDHSDGITAAELTPRAFTYDNPAAASSDESWPMLGSPIPQSHEFRLETSALTRDAQLGSPITSPISNPYASTTDDDDGITFSRPSAGPHDTYFPLQPPPPSTSLLRRRSTIKALPPQLSHVPQSLATEEEEWDYTDTAWWGYIILFVTWLVFVVGMGSCLGIWSWAWDVGETPYAPPELEDDPTLPIVGYYPALMVLTAVMAWVWVVVAWVGMKYFRHAKVVQS